MKELKPNKVNMMKDLLPKLMIVATILIGVGIFWLVSTRPGAGVGANAALTLEEPPSTCGYCERNLVGATSEEIGEFVVDLAMTQLNPQGSPEVLAVRSIVWEESAQLGLGCLPDFASIEDAPLAVVILKGDMDLGSAVLGLGSLPAEQRRVKYVAIVMDLWAASWVHLTGSPTGEQYNLILNDPTLPQSTADQKSECPPRAPRTVHYGQSAGGVIYPTPEPGATIIVEPTEVIPQPVSTTEPGATIIVEPTEVIP
ncbi:MAG: hypothetical protein WCD37_18980 [Chloroflexia bacterium]